MRVKTAEVARELRLKLGYVPFPKQNQFHGSNAKYRLFGGAAGPGKTKALLMEAVLQAWDHPGANTLLLRRDVSGTGVVAAALFPAGCAARDI